MKKFIVETFYTCTFKTTHTLDELNDKELSKIDNRKDGEVEIIDVKLNNRKTKKFGEKTSNENNKNEKIDSFVEKIPNEVVTNKASKINQNDLTGKIKNLSKERFRMPDRRKGYI